MLKPLTETSFLTMSIRRPSKSRLMARLSGSNRSKKEVYESAYAIARPQIQAGKIKVLAATNTARASAIPDIPTVAEAGYPALTMDGLVGLFGPLTTPNDLRERIAADIKAVMDADPLINDRLIMTAQIPNPGGPAEFAKSIDEQRAVLARQRRTLASRRNSTQQAAEAASCGADRLARQMLRD
jgi:hypothetical protein